MISNRVRESRRTKTLNLSRNLQRLYKEGKCRKCSIVVTRMDFAKILGKFTKVKIQYESVSSSKKKNTLPVNSKESVSPTNARLKNNENGMVLLPRNAYNQHPAKDLKQSRSKAASPHVGNVLKENNRLKKTPQPKKGTKTTTLSSKKQPNLIKQYRIVFVNPKNKSINENKSKITLAELIPLINTTLLPSKDWSIDYLPKSNDIKGDKVYDRIAAELEDLMYNEKPKHEEKTEPSENKVDDFPSIMDILNDTTGVQSANNSEEIKATLESSDVEAMLLGKGENPENNTVVNGSTSESSVVNNDTSKTVIGNLPDTDFPPSPSILKENETCSDERVKQQNSSTVDQMDIEESTTNNISEEIKIEKCEDDTQSTEDGNKNSMEDSNKVLENKEDNAEDESSENDKIKSLVKVKQEDNITCSEKDKNENNNLVPKSVTRMIFNNTIGDKCYKSVTCLKNLKYIVELEGKQVEFIGAPRFISSIEDLKVLLQIVNECELESLYVLR